MKLQTTDAAALRELLDRSALEDLAMRYARGIDRRDRAMLLSCYHPDAVDEHGTMFTGDPVAFADWQPEVMGPFDNSAHYILNKLYRIDGDKAEGELYFYGIHRTHPPEAREVTVCGRYLDRYERRAGEWRISHRSLVWDFVRDDPVVPAARAFLEGLGELGKGEDDMSYAALPLLRVPG